MGFKLVRSGSWMRFLARPATLFVVLSLVSMAGLASLAAEAASAARYTVAQCGWHVGHDATWPMTASPPA